MSEYQCYEWQALDRALSSQDRVDIGKLSSHITVTANSAWVEYHWSDFRHDPLDVLARYFDAFLYMANWGNKQLAFRFPANLIDPWLLQPYIVEPYIDLHQFGDHQVLSINMFSDEPVDEWVESEGWLTALTPLRKDILRGDYRLLYLAWLQAVELDGGNEIAEDEPEPPLPAGLAELTAAQQTFANWIELDPHLLACAASNSATLREKADAGLAAAVASLSRQECDEFLMRLLQDEPLLSMALRRRLQTNDGELDHAPELPRRRVAELLALRDGLVAEEERQQAEADRIRRISDMEELAQRVEQEWQHVERLLATSYQAHDYDAAIISLIKLRQLAEHRDSLPAFQVRMDELATRYRRRSSLQDRFRRYHLV